MPSPVYPAWADSCWMNGAETRVSMHARDCLSPVGSASPRRALQARMPTPLGPHGKGRRGRLGARSLWHLVVRASNSLSICPAQGIVAEIEGIAEAHRRHVATALWWRSSKPKPGISGAVSRVHARRRIRPAERTSGFPKIDDLTARALEQFARR
jgi:hypothetical protein